MFAITGVLGAFALAGFAVLFYWVTTGRYIESTEDAYVVGNLVQITPQVPGTVTAVTAQDTDFVKAGQILIELDKADSAVALDAAEAQLARSVRQVRHLMATTAEFAATVELRGAELRKARQDLARRDGLAGSGAVSAEETQHARDAITAADASLTLARQQAAAHRTLVDGTTLENHPEVRSAAARVREAHLAWSRTAMTAPVSGFVARRNVQLGQRVSPGTPLMTVVALDQVWVEANFKEAQLASLRVGQPVRLRADLYGAGVEYQGRIAGFGAGTGSAFALLPAQNATGNWIKVVQRVPVRIALDAAQLQQHPLQIGLSMQVEVNIRDGSGERLPRLARSQPAVAPVTTPSATTAATKHAEQRVATIIAAQRAGEQSAAIAGLADDDAERTRAESARNDSAAARAGRMATGAPLEAGTPLGASTPLGARRATDRTMQ
ncbi:MAG: HlyD family efflux transporter periplasmic adaptor subunit [Betaproteobacteria bacterium]|nr:HlyD family efflux transporter periplasmic adaptor subunit [Betaproteobacteria bacterium]